LFYKELWIKDVYPHENHIESVYLALFGTNQKSFW
jgi:hypothetical protein